MVETDGGSLESRMVGAQSGRKVCKKGLKKKKHGIGARLDQLVGHGALDLGVVTLSPKLGVELI